MKKVLLIILISVVVIAALIFGGMYYMGTRFLDAVIDSELSAALDKAIDMEEIPEISNLPEKGELDENNKTSSAVDQGKNSQDKQEDKSKTYRGKSVTPKKEKVPGSKNSSKKENMQAQPKPDKAITVEKLKEIKDSITITDKMEASAMALKNFSLDDINIIKNMISGGISTEEKAQIRQLILERFKGKELEEIKKMYEKYLL